MKDEADSLDEAYEPEQMVLSDLINRVLDKGVVLSADITISVADVDLIQLDLKVLVSSIVTMRNRQVEREPGRRDRLFVRPRPRS